MSSQPVWSPSCTFRLTAAEFFDFYFFLSSIIDWDRLRAMSRGYLLYLMYYSCFCSSLCSSCIEWACWDKADRGTHTSLCLLSVTVCKFIKFSPLWRIAISYSKTISGFSLAKNVCFTQYPMLLSACMNNARLSSVRNVGLFLWKDALELMILFRKWYQIMMTNPIGSGYSWSTNLDSIYLWGFTLPKESHTLVFHEGCSTAAVQRLSGIAVCHVVSTPLSVSKLITAMQRKWNKCICYFNYIWQFYS